MSAYDHASILINRCKGILALVDTYVDCPTQDHRTSLRKALIAEFDVAASAPPVAAEVETIQQARANFEDWYTGHAADIKAAPIGSRDSMLQWSSWIAARSGNYVARSGWKISPRPWGPAGAPVVASSVDTDMDALLTACESTYRIGPYHGFISSLNAIRACAASQREELLSTAIAADQARQRAEKAEADLNEANEWRASALAENMQSGERWAKRVAELEAQLARRGAPLSPETQQAIAAARAADQSIAATPGGLVFMNDGAERGCSTLDCPACGGSGHAADAAAGSTP